MSRTGIGYPEVELAAEKLVQEGISPTIERIRLLLGTGSNSTVSKYLAEWKTRQLKQRMEGQSVMTLPTESLNQAVAHVWGKLQAENQAKLVALEEETKQKIQLAQEEKNRVLDELHRAKEDNQNLRALLKKVRGQNSVLEEEQIRLNQTLAVLESKCHTVEDAYKDFQKFANETMPLLETKYQQVITHYDMQLTESQAFYKKELSQIKEIAERQRHEHIVEIDHLKTNHQKLQTQLMEKDKILIQLNHKVEQLIIQLHTQQEKVLGSLATLQADKKVYEEITSETLAKVYRSIQQGLHDQTKKLLMALQQTRKASKLKKDKIT